MATKYDQEYWKKEFDEADKRLEKYHKKGDKIIERYLDYRSDDATDTFVAGSQFRLNLFNAHVSMLLAMLYGRVPETDVRRRWEDPDDDVARVAAEILRRVLNSGIEPPGGDVPDVLRAALQDRLLPGHGIARIRYTFESEEVPNPDYLSPELSPDVEETVELATEEDAPVDYVHWRDFKWGFGRLWKDVPWCAFRLYLDKEECTERFGQRNADKLSFETHKVADTGMMQDVKRGTINEAEVWEVWHRKTRKVYFYAAECDELLAVKPDPLELVGFLPCPEPMIANPTTTLYRPTPDWQICQDLYNEIDILQTRISIVTKAIKVVGTYDQSQPAIQRMLKEGVDNDLIPVDNWAAFAEKGGVRGCVDWFPLENVVAALSNLKEMLAATIEMLYQVTGLSDILRGAAGPDRESAQSAGQRARFASIRVQHLQEEFARFASELLTIRAQVICKHWEVQNIARKANAQYLMDKGEAVMEALQLLKDGRDAWGWRIEIKPESVAMIDYAQLQSERVEYLNATATFLQSANSMLQVVPGAAPMLISMLKWGLAGFKGSQQIEGVLDQAMDAAIKALQQPKPEDDEAQKKLAEVQAKSQAKMQEQAQKHQLEMEKLMADFQARSAELAQEADATVLKEKAQAQYNSMEKMIASSLKMREIEAQNRGKLELERAKPKPKPVKAKA